MVLSGDCVNRLAGLEARSPLFTELPRRVLLGTGASGTTKRNGEKNPHLQVFSSRVGRTRTCIYEHLSDTCKYIQSPSRRRHQGFFAVVRGWARVPKSGTLRAPLDAVACSCCLSSGNRLWLSLRFMPHARPQPHLFVGVQLRFSFYCCPTAAVLPGDVHAVLVS